MGAFSHSRKPEEPRQRTHRIVLVLVLVVVLEIGPKIENEDDEEKIVVFIGSTNLTPGLVTGKVPE
jgi:hypothetical protein